MTTEPCGLRGGLALLLNDELDNQELERGGAVLMATTGRKQRQAEDIVKRYSYGSLLPGLVPIPWVDVALIAGVQLKMVQRLAKLYETPFSEQLGKSAIGALVGGGAAGSLAVISANLLRPVPILGQIGGVLTMSLFGSASTYAVGKVFTQHFETGGTLLTFDAKKMKAYYKEQFSQGESGASASHAGMRL